MNKIINIIFLIVSVVQIVVICLPASGYCFDDKKTHPDLTGRASKTPKFNNYLISTLGFPAGFDESISSTSYLAQYHKIGKASILKWLQLGSTDEDAPTCRASTHFHDPLQPWDSSYMNDEPGYITLLCQQIPPVWPQYSNIIWATGFKTRDQVIPVARDRQDMGWDDARRNFYAGLTETSQANRDDYFVNTFRAVGQVMHLLQDMAVPAHVRNDFQSHIDFNGIKGNSRLNPISWIGNAFEYYVKLQSGLVTNADPSRPDFVNTKLTDYWDTDGNGAIPGLAEFTNGNFFSDETIYANIPTLDHMFPYPSFDSPTTPTKVIFPGKTTDLYECDDLLEKKDIFGTSRLYPRKYLSQKVCPLPGGEVDHFAAVSFLNTSSSNKLYMLDNNVHDTYAKELLPKAVGYSASLLDYFFRGTLSIDVVAPEDITFSSIKVTASNSTPNETMGIGEVSLVIRYKALAESGTGTEKTLAYPSADYSYKVVKLSNVDLSSPRELPFDFSADPLPLNYSEMTMQLVYKGKLGNEDNSVAVSVPKAIDGITCDFILSLPPSGVFAKTSDNSTNATFDELKVTALSKIPGGLSGGTITLALEYRTAVDDQFQSVLVNTEPANAAGYIFRTTEKNSVSTLPENIPVELVFDLSLLPLSIRATKVEINVIYTHTNGVSQSIGYIDISEPTPVDVYNTTDYTCINNTWYRYDDPAAVAIADISDTKPHIISNVSFLVGPYDSTALDARESNTLFAAGPLPPGQSLRLGYILTDVIFNYAYSETRTDSIGDSLVHNPTSETYPGLGYKNDGGLQYMLFPFRGAKLWQGAGVIFINRAYPLGSACTFESLDQILMQ